MRPIPPKDTRMMGTGIRSCMNGFHAAVNLIRFDPIFVSFPNDANG